MSYLGPLNENVNYKLSIVQIKMSCKFTHNNKYSCYIMCKLLWTITLWCCGTCGTSDSEGDNIKSTHNYFALESHFAALWHSDVLSRLCRINFETNLAWPNYYPILFMNHAQCESTPKIMHRQLAQGLDPSSYPCERSGSHVTTQRKETLDHSLNLYSNPADPIRLQLS